MKTDPLLISIDTPAAGFEEFLKDVENKRIFFSGQYGIGKTFFLKEFFKAHKESYDVYHLYPTRYQISSNENIIELLKYDILMEFLKIYPDGFKKKGDKGSENWLRLFVAFCKDKGSINGFLKSTLEIGGNLLELSPDPFTQTLAKLGRPLTDVLELDKKFQEFKKTRNSEEQIKKFLKEIETEVDTIGTDYVSELLRQRIQELKGDKRSVLVVDDFDRIDPEHIFRILNVLSAHMENDNDNKFGFDHIIVVGSVDNLESIFHHRYGPSVDFSGYLDKFFTIEPYEFDNTKAIRESIPHLVRGIKYEEHTLKDGSGVIRNFLEEVLGRAFDISEINVRQIYKPLKHSFSVLKKGHKGDPIFSDTVRESMDISIRLLISLLHGKKKFLSTLEKIREAAVVSDSRDDRLYDRYASPLARQLTDLKVGQTGYFLNEKYQIEVVQNPSHSAKTDIHLKANAHGQPIEANAIYFYDVLIEYIKKSKYVAKNQFQYDL